MEHFRAATAWYTVDQEVELTPEFATQVLIDMSDPRSEYLGSCGTNRRLQTTSSVGGWRS